MIREDYLESLGYKPIYDFVYAKTTDDGFWLGIDLEPGVENPIFCGKPNDYSYTSEEEIQILLKYFKEVERDFEETKKYKD